MKSSRKNVNEIFERIAVQNNTTADEVRRDIKAAIKVGSESSDPETQRLWAKVPRRGALPTPEEMLLYLRRVAKNQDVDLLLRQYFNW